MNKYVIAPDFFAEQRANEILCHVGDILKALFIKLPLRCCHKSQSLCVTFTLKWRFTAQPARENQIQITQWHFSPQEGSKSLKD